MSQLTNKEKNILNDMNEQKISFRKVIKIHQKIFEGLCLQCRNKVFNISNRKRESRTELFGNLKTYCEKCQDKIQTILKKENL